MNGMLVLHLTLGILIVLVTLVAIGSRGIRRVLLYILTLQIIVGGALMGKLPITPLHWGLAILAWFALMLANSIERRTPQRRPIARRWAIVAAASVIIVFMIGWMAAHATVV